MANDAASVEARAQLEQERDDLRRQLAELGGLDYDPNFADSSQVTAERGETEVLVNKLQETLTDVEAALAKLETGAYGVCEGCGERINPARLEAMPAARLCIDCASSRR